MRRDFAGDLQDLRGNLRVNSSLLVFVEPEQANLPAKTLKADSKLSAKEVHWATHTDGREWLKKSWLISYISIAYRCLYMMQVYVYIANGCQYTGLVNLSIDRQFYLSIANRCLYLRQGYLTLINQKLPSIRVIRAISVEFYPSLR